MTESPQDLVPLMETIQVDAGEYVLTRVDYENYPHEPHVFVATYELVE